MSTARSGRFASIDLDGSIGPDSFRVLALGGIALLTASYVTVLRDVTSIVGEGNSLLPVVAGMIVAAAILAHTIRPRTAAIAAVVVIVLGVDTYLDAAGVSFGAVVAAADQIAADTLMFATGLPIVRVVAVGTWALAFVPGPVFLSWYLAFRKRYALSVVPGGAALCFLVLTGDAGTTATLLGTLGGIAAVGFGELERRGGSIAHADVLAILFAVMAALSLSVAFAGTSSLFGQADPATLETTLDASPERSSIEGSVDLSPEVRFTVESSEASYWRTGVYDRFTGDEWVRTGETSQYDGSIDSPPGETDRLTHTVTVEGTQETMPTAPQPVSLEGSGVDIAEVTDQGQVQPTAPLVEGDSYTVRSEQLDPEPETLAAADTDYPEDIETRYTQTPDSTSATFESYTEDVVSNADNPYEQAAAIEAFLQESKSYSLDVERPDGDVAEAFLLEMDEGYCVYFATAMTQMLRTQDIPARYVTGYTPGQSVGDDEWVVRGLDAHAWVEVYFPDHGWVAFDPTPADRDASHQDALEEAREDGVDGVDTEQSEGAPLDQQSRLDDETDPDETDPGETDPGGNETDPSGNETDLGGNETDPGGSDPGDNATDPEDNQSDLTPQIGTPEEPEENDDESFLPAFSPERLGIAFVLLIGLAAGVRRTGLAEQVSREARLYWHGSGGTPERDAGRAYRRLEILLARRYRPRRPTESVRAYIEALSADHDLDSRVHDVVHAHERATYAGAVDRDAANRAVRAVDDLARERVPVLGRRRS